MTRCGIFFITSPPCHHPTTGARVRDTRAGAAPAAGAGGGGGGQRRGWARRASRRGGQRTSWCDVAPAPAVALPSHAHTLLLRPTPPCFPPAAPGEPYEFNAAACARRALKNKALVGGTGGLACAASAAVAGGQRGSSPALHRCQPRHPRPPPQGYLAALGDPAVTQQLARRFREATNMTDEISALAALDRAGGCCGDRVAPAGRAGVGGRHGWGGEVAGRPPTSPMRSQRWRPWTAQVGERLVERVSGRREGRRMRRPQASTRRRRHPARRRRPAGRQRGLRGGAGRRAVRLLRQVAGRAAGAAQVVCAAGAPSPAVCRTARPRWACSEQAGCRSGGWRCGCAGRSCVQRVERQSCVARRGAGARAPPGVRGGWAQAWPAGACGRRRPAAARPTPRPPPLRSAPCCRASAQAGSNAPGNVAAVRALEGHPAFHNTNPNSCYSLYLGFARSPVNFHAGGWAGSCGVVLARGAAARSARAVRAPLRLTHQRGRAPMADSPGCRSSPAHRSPSPSTRRPTLCSTRPTTSPPLATPQPTAAATPSWPTRCWPLTRSTTRWADAAAEFAGGEQQGCWAGE